MNIEHRTSNNQHPMPDAHELIPHFGVGCWMLDVRCSMFDVFQQSPSTLDPRPSPSDTNRMDEAWLGELRLADGTVVRFRHVRPEDEPLITGAIRTASRETLLHRFFSPIRSVSPEMLRRMLGFDRSSELCIVGVVEKPDSMRIVCGARYVRLPRPGAAEIALTVHDDFQRRGLGTFLLKLLTQLAVADGIRRFEADVMGSNEKMLGIFRKLAPDRSGWRRLGDVYHVVIDLPENANREA
jgi:RimJ/RimL family protein N-acetyltransferase